MTLTDWIMTDYADRLEDDGKSKLGLLSERATRVFEMLNGIQAYCRIDGSQRQWTNFNLNKHLAGGIDLLDVPNHIEITIEDPLPAIHMNPTQRALIFQNLLINAIKYLDKPRGQIDIGCRDLGTCWQFSCSDNGPGIHKDHLE